MTIIQPNKNKDFIKLTITLGLISVLVIVYGIFIYLQTVSLRHDLEVNKSNLEKLRLQNAELKNKFFQLVDSDNLEALAKARGLIQEKNPQWVSASRY